MDLYLKDGAAAQAPNCNCSVDTPSTRSCVPKTESGNREAAAYEERMLRRLFGYMNCGCQLVPSSIQKQVFATAQAQLSKLEQLEKVSASVCTAGISAQEMEQLDEAACRLLDEMRALKDSNVLSKELNEASIIACIRSELKELYQSAQTLLRYSQQIPRSFQPQRPSDLRSGDLLVYESGDRIMIISPAEHGNSASVATLKIDGRVEVCDAVDLSTLIRRHDLRCAERSNNPSLYPRPFIRQQAAPQHFGELQPGDTLVEYINGLQNARYEYIAIEPSGAGAYKATVISSLAGGGPIAINRIEIPADRKPPSEHSELDLIWQRPQSPPDGDLHPAWMAEKNTRRLTLAERLPDSLQKTVYVASHAEAWRYERLSSFKLEHLAEARMTLGSIEQGLVLSCTHRQPNLELDEHCSGDSPAAVMQIELRQALSKYMHSASCSTAQCNILDKLLGESITALEEIEHQVLLFMSTPIHMHDGRTTALDRLRTHQNMIQSAVQDALTVLREDESRHLTKHHQLAANIFTALAGCASAVELELLRAPLRLTLFEARDLQPGDVIIEDDNTRHLVVSRGWDQSLSVEVISWPDPTECYAPRTMMISAPYLSAPLAVERADCPSLRPRSILNRTALPPTTDNLRPGDVIQRRIANSIHHSLIFHEVLSVSQPDEGNAVLEVLEYCNDRPPERLSIKTPHYSTTGHSAVVLRRSSDNGARHLAPCITPQATVALQLPQQLEIIDPELAAQLCHTTTPQYSLGLGDTSAFMPIDAGTLFQFPDGERRLLLSIIAGEASFVSLSDSKPAVKKFALEEMIAEASFTAIYPPGAAIIAGERSEIPAHLWQAAPPQPGDVVFYADGSRIEILRATPNEHTLDLMMLRAQASKPIRLEHTLINNEDTSWHQNFGAMDCEIGSILRLRSGHHSDLGQDRLAQHPVLSTFRDLLLEIERRAALEAVGRLVTLQHAPLPGDQLLESQLVQLEALHCRGIELLRHFERLAAHATAVDGGFLNPLRDDLLSDLARDRLLSTVETQADADDMPNLIGALREAIERIQNLTTEDLTTEDRSTKWQKEPPSLQALAEYEMAFCRSVKNSYTGFAHSPSGLHVRHYTAASISDTQLARLVAIVQTAPGVPGDKRILKDGVMIAKDTVTSLREQLADGLEIVTCEEPHPEDNSTVIQGYLAYYPPHCLPRKVRQKVISRYPEAGLVAYGDMYAVSPELRARLRETGQNGAPAALLFAAASLHLQRFGTTLHLGQIEHENLPSFCTVLKQLGLVNGFDIDYTRTGNGTTAAWIGVLLPVSSAARAEFGAYATTTTMRDSPFIAALRQAAEASVYDNRQANLAS